MKWIALTSLLLLATACSGGPAERPTDPEIVLAEIEHFLTTYRSVVEAKDTATLRTMYVADGRFAWIEDGKVAYDTPDAVIAALSSLPAEFGMTTDYTDTDVSLLAGNAAHASMRYRTVMRQGTSEFAFGGMITIVLERTPDGWRIVSGHASTDRGDER